MDIRKFFRQKDVTATQKRNLHDSLKVPGPIPAKVRPTTSSSLLSAGASNFTLSVEKNLHHCQSSEVSLPQWPSTISIETSDVTTLDATDVDDVNPSHSVSTVNMPEERHSLVVNHSFDLGEYINHSVSDEVKYLLLTNPRALNSSHDFKKDIDEQKPLKRPFQKTWLEKYSWLVYSPKLKGGLCKFCTLFKPVLKRGIFGAFVIKAHQDYKHFHEDARGHEKSSWHLESTSKGISFCESVEMRKKNVIEQLDSGITELVNANRKKLKSILSTLIFCGTHDISIRGKNSNEGNFQDLLSFRVSAGDKVLEDHLQNHSGKAKYTSHRVQNNLISICGSVLQHEIVDEVNRSAAFSLLADETADISGKEQLSVGVRFVDEKLNFTVKEEFLGFAELSTLDAEGISSSILKFAENLGLDMNKLIGLGFDGCSTMAGHESGVQARIRKKYPSAVYFHCASHRLNLVVNDLNSVQEIRNTVGTIKEVIRFFRESVLRRKTIPNITLFCETRWSHKYTSIRVFKENFLRIKDSLSHLANNSENNQDTRSRANLLDSATSSATFIICLHIISRYSSYLEPIVNKLQGTDIDLYSVYRYINTDLLASFQKQRESNDEFTNIFEAVKEDCKELDIDIKIPRLAGRQIHRCNVNVKFSTPEDYFKVAIYNPYMDSIITSLTTRFEKSKDIPFKGGILHPHLMKKEKKESFMRDIKSLQAFYQIDNLEAEARLWYDTWTNKDCMAETELHDILKETMFYPAVRRLLVLYQTIPPTTCTVERSFSTLRRVKTWLRSTIGADRLSGLCLLSVHRKRAKNPDFENKVIDLFGKNKRNLQFAFSDKY